MDSYLCRLCLGKRTLMWVFDDDLQPHILQEAVYATCNIKMSKDDPITQMMCSTCCQIILGMFKFRTRAIKIDNDLRAKHAQMSVLNLTPLYKKTVKRGADEAMNALFEISSAKKLKTTNNDDSSYESSEYSSLISKSNKTRIVYQCNVCYSPFSSIRNLRKHEKQTHMKCPFCGKRFRSLTMAKDHVKSSCNKNATSPSLIKKELIIRLVKVEADKKIRDKYPHAFENSIELSSRNEQSKPPNHEVICMSEYEDTNKIQILSDVSINVPMTSKNIVPSNFVCTSDDDTDSELRDEILNVLENSVEPTTRNPETQSSTSKPKSDHNGVQILSDVSIQVDPMTSKNIGPSNIVCTSDDELVNVDTDSKIRDEILNVLENCVEPTTRNQQTQSSNHEVAEGGTSKPKFDHNGVQILSDVSNQVVPMIFKIIVPCNSVCASNNELVKVDTNRDIRNEIISDLENCVEPTNRNQQSKPPNDEVIFISLDERGTSKPKSDDNCLQIMSDVSTLADEDETKRPDFLNQRDTDAQVLKDVLVAADRRRRMIHANLEMETLRKKTIIKGPSRNFRTFKDLINCLHKFLILIEISYSTEFVVEYKTATLPENKKLRDLWFDMSRIEIEKPENFRMCQVPHNL